jgi:hypothetical protein
MMLPLINEDEYKGHMTCINALGVRLAKGTEKVIIINGMICFVQSILHFNTNAIPRSHS